MDPDQPILDAKAAATVATVRAGLDAQETVPMVSQLVRLIRDISGKAEKMSIDELVEAISAEPTTLARVMSVASKMFYNPAGGEIVSVHQAVSAIGFEQVRHLAISILLLENAQSSFSAEANRELAGVALVSGLMAAELGRRGLPIDPDLAFVCSMLRTYGRMLAATFMADRYSGLLKATGMSDDEGFHAGFGLTPVELAREVLSGQQLPRIVLDSLVDPSAEMRRQTDRLSMLICAAEFAQHLTALLNSADLTTENLVPRLEALARRYAEPFQMGELPVRELVARVSVTLSNISAHCGLPLESVVLFRRLECVATSRPIPAVPRARGRTAGVSAGTRAASNEAVARDEATLRAAKSLESCTAVMMRLVSEPHPDPRRIFELLLQTLHENLHLSNCLVFVKHRQSGLFRVTRGVGPLMKFARDTVALDPQIANIFSEAISGEGELLIENPNEPSVRPAIPEWLCPEDQQVPILLLPIKSPSGTFALVCATCAGLEGFRMAEKLLPELLLLLKQAGRVGEFLA
jgi:hypothetical protein